MVLSSFFIVELYTPFSTLSTIFFSQENARFVSCVLQFCKLWPHRIRRSPHLAGPWLFWMAEAYPTFSKGATLEVVCV